MLLLLLSSLTSAFKVHFPIASGSSMSVSYVVDIASIILRGPHATMIVGAVSGWSQTPFNTQSKQPPYRTLFNMACLALTVEAAGEVYVQLGGTPHVELTAGLAIPLAAMALTYYFANTLMIATAVALSTRQSVWYIWKSEFASFWPKGQKMFLHAAGIAPGEVGIINASIPGTPTMATGILVIYADDVSFSFLSPEGHPFAGPLTFSAQTDDQGTTVAQVQELTRASDPFWELTMMVPVLGDRMQNEIWRSTLANLAKHFGADDARVHSKISCVDARRQWRNARNIWHNAAIRSGLAAPLRLLDLCPMARRRAGWAPLLRRPGATRPPHRLRSLRVGSRWRAR